MTFPSRKSTGGLENTPDQSGDCEMNTTYLVLCLNIEVLKQFVWQNEGGWDKYLQAFKIYLVISHTFGQHALTKVVQKTKIHDFKQFWSQK